MMKNFITILGLGFTNHVEAKEQYAGTGSTDYQHYGDHQTETTTVPKAMPIMRPAALDSHLYDDTDYYTHQSLRSLMHDQFNEGIGVGSSIMNPQQRLAAFFLNQAAIAQGGGNIPMYYDYKEKGTPYSSTFPGREGKLNEYVSDSGANSDILFSHRHAVEYGFEQKGTSRWGLNRLARTAVRGLKAGANALLKLTGVVSFFSSTVGMFKKKDGDKDKDGDNDHHASDSDHESTGMTKNMVEDVMENNMEQLSTVKKLLDMSSKFEDMDHFETISGIIDDPMNTLFAVENGLDQVDSAFKDSKYMSQWLLDRPSLLDEMQRFGGSKENGIRFPKMGTLAFDSNNRVLTMGFRYDDTEGTRSKVKVFSSMPVLMAAHSATVSNRWKAQGGLSKNRRESVSNMLRDTELQHVLKKILIEVQMDSSELATKTAEDLMMERKEFIQSYFAEGSPAIEQFSDVKIDSRMRTYFMRHQRTILAGAAYYLRYYHTDAPDSRNTIHLLEAGNHCGGSGFAAYFFKEVVIPMLKAFRHDYGYGERGWESNVNVCCIGFAGAGVFDTYNSNSHGVAGYALNPQPDHNNVFQVLDISYKGGSDLFAPVAMRSQNESLWFPHMSFLSQVYIPCMNSNGCLLPMSSLESLAAMVTYFGERVLNDDPTYGETTWTVFHDGTPETTAPGDEPEDVEPAPPVDQETPPPSIPGRKMQIDFEVHIGNPREVPSVLFDPLEVDVELVQLKKDIDNQLPTNPEGRHDFGHAFPHALSDQVADAAEKAKYWLSSQYQLRREAQWDMLDDKDVYGLLKEQLTIGVDDDLDHDDLVKLKYSLTPDGDYGPLDKDTVDLGYLREKVEDVVDVEDEDGTPLYKKGTVYVAAEFQMGEYTFALGSEDYEGDGSMKKMNFFHGNFAEMKPILAGFEETTILNKWLSTVFPSAPNKKGVEYYWHVEYKDADTTITQGYYESHVPDGITLLDMPIINLTTKEMKQQAASALAKGDNTGKYVITLVKRHVPLRHRSVNINFMGEYYYSANAQTENKRHAYISDGMATPITELLQSNLENNPEHRDDNMVNVFPADEALSWVTNKDYRSKIQVDDLDIADDVKVLDYLKEMFLVQTDAPVVFYVEDQDNGEQIMGLDENQTFGALKSSIRQKSSSSGDVGPIEAESKVYVHFKRQPVTFNMESVNGETGDVAVLGDDMAGVMKGNFAFAKPLLAGFNPSEVQHWFDVGFDLPAPGTMIETYHWKLKFEKITSETSEETIMSQESDKGDLKTALEMTVHSLAKKLNIDVEDYMTSEDGVKITWSMTLVRSFDPTTIPFAKRRKRILAKSDPSTQ